MPDTDNPTEAFNPAVAENVNGAFNESPAPIDEEENEARMLKGHLYHAFMPGLTIKRNRCHHACHRFNQAGEQPRRKLVELWREIIDDNSPLPAPGNSDEEDFELLADEPYIDGPIRVDYGTNLSGTHPTDPSVRNGIRGPELGKPITIGKDCWLGGNVIILPGVTIGDGSTIGAGSVVTRDVPSRVIVAGNPAKVIRGISSSETGR
ncbi:galactoside O-acetyltransferase [Phlyctema vagabunda]|uniref:Galactoside O-acetyltransferase n=1 Tax=Phlyctema vagabunda TaxID=108571 RepID=A0ABR4P1Y5_9HELO